MTPCTNAPSTRHHRLSGWLPGLLALLSLAAFSPVYAAPAGIDYVLRPEVFAGCRRRVGHGWTVLLDGLGDRLPELQAVLSVLLRRTPEFLPGVAPLAPLDGLADGRFATQTAEGVLWYDAEGSRIRLEPAP